MSKEATLRRKKIKASSKNGGETEEGILACICKKKSEKGTMIQCEACTVWQHTQCLGMNDNELPSHYICNSCLSSKEDSPKDFSFISNRALRKEFEDDFANERKVVDQSKEKHRRFSPSERQLLDKYFGRFSTTNDLKEKDSILLGVSVLLGCSTFGVGNLFKFIAEEATGHNKEEEEEEEDEDPYKDWMQTKKNIYWNGVSQNAPTSEAFDTDMQEPVELQVRKYGNEWGIMLQQPVEKKQFLAEYFGIWLTPNVACYEDTSPATRFVLAHPNSDICVDARRSGSIVRFLRRSCEPNAEVREVIGNDNTRRLGVFALESLPANVELTIGFDRPWKNYSCALKCACGSTSCPVAKWYNERSLTATRTLDIFRKKQTLLKLKAVNGRKSTPQEDSDVEEAEGEQEKDGEEEEDSDDSEDNDEKEETTRSTRGKKPQASRKTKTGKRGTAQETAQQKAANGNLSREERKLQLIMRSIEKMENRERMATITDNKKKKGKPEKVSKGGKRKTPEPPPTLSAARKRTRVDSESEEEAEKLTTRRVSSKETPASSPGKAEKDPKSPKQPSSTRIETPKRRLSTSVDSDPKPVPSSPLPPPAVRSASPMTVNLSSPPPPSSTGAKVATKKAWLQDFEEKKSDKSEKSEGNAHFPLKKKMLSNFYAAAASSTDGKIETTPVVLPIVTASSSPKQSKPPSSPQPTRLSKGEKPASPSTSRAQPPSSPTESKNKMPPSPQRKDAVKREDTPSFRRSADSISFRATDSSSRNSPTPTLATTAVAATTTTTSTTTVPSSASSSSVRSYEDFKRRDSDTLPTFNRREAPVDVNGRGETVNSVLPPPLMNGTASYTSTANHTTPTPSSEYYDSYSRSGQSKSPPFSSSSTPSSLKSPNGSYSASSYNRGTPGILQTPPLSSRSSYPPPVTSVTSPPTPVSPSASDYRFRSSSNGNGVSNSTASNTPTLNSSGSSISSSTSSNVNGSGLSRSYGSGLPPPPPPPYGGGGSHWSNRSGGLVRAQDRYPPRRDYF